MPSPSGTAIKAVEHSLALRRRDAGAGVDDLEHGAASGRRHAEIHPSARRRMTDRVVQKIAEQHAQAVGVALHRDRRRLGHPEVDALGMRDGGPLSGHAARELVEAHRGERPLDRFGLEPRHREQLLGEMRGALDAQLELRQGCLALLLRACGLEQLDLQLDRGERRAQLVRGIGRELALRRECLRQPRRAGR